jgi:hypothetical protein
MILKKTFRQLETKLNCEVYVKSIDPNNKNQYIIRHREKLLPQWTTDPVTIILLFFQTKCLLDGTDLFQEQREKDRLLITFNQLGNRFYYLCKKQNILSEIICPKEGTPQYSKKGPKIFSIQTLVACYLSSFKVDLNKCGLTHPLWGKAVYPCSMLSGAQIAEVKPLIEEIILNF